MARDGTARARVQQLLATSGPVRDLSGYATGELKDAIAYRGSAVAFIQLIAAMERDGEIVREIRGKRTYEIAATESTVKNVAEYPVMENAGADGPRGELAAGLELDYDQLASALLRELWSTAKATVSATDAPPAAKAGAEHEDYTRRLEAARAKLDELLDVDRHRSGTSASRG